MEVRYQVTEEGLWVQMPKELDHHVAATLCGRIDGLVEEYRVRELVLDFSETEFMDSSGIGMLIGRSRTMGFRKGRVSATGMSNRIRRLFDAAGLGQLIAVKEELNGE